MKTENEVWELLENWLKTKGNKNEVLSCEWGINPHSNDGICKVIRIFYFRVDNNKLTRYTFDISMKFLQRMSTMVTTSILAEIVDKFRRDDCDD